MRLYVLVSQTSVRIDKTRCRFSCLPTSLFQRCHCCSLPFHAEVPHRPYCSRLSIVPHSGILQFLKHWAVLRTVSGLLSERKLGDNLPDVLPLVLFQSLLPEPCKFLYSATGRLVIRPRNCNIHYWHTYGREMSARYHFRPDRHTSCSLCPK